MIRLLGVLVFILISSLFTKTTYANEKIVNLLKVGGKVVFIRHAYAPGSGDPYNFDIKNCSTQRNLNMKVFYNQKISVISLVKIIFK